MEKLLIISYSFPPSNAPAAQRAYYFAKYLPENNIKPIVLTTSQNLSSLGYGNSMNTTGMQILDTSNSNSQSVLSDGKKATSKDIVKNSWLKKILIQFLFPDRGIIWLPQAIKTGSKFLRENRDVNYIFTTAPSFTNFLIALLLSKKFNKKLVCDFRDFYVVNGLFKRIFPLNYLDVWLEKRIVKKSTALIFISKNMKSVYEKKYKFISAKSNLIYNGFDENDFISLPEIKKENQESLTIFFAGSLYSDSKHPRNIFLLLDILEELIKHGSIDKKRVLIKIAAHINEDIFEKLNRHFLFDNIIFLGIIKREDVLIEMQNANLFWHMLGDSKQDLGAIPIKTFEYIASGKPTLFFIPKGAELETIATEHNLGYVCHLEADAFENNCNVVLKAYHEIVVEKKEIVLDKTSLHKFTRRYQAQQLAEIIYSLNK